MAGQAIGHFRQAGALDLLPHPGMASFAARPWRCGVRQQVCSGFSRRFQNRSDLAQFQMKLMIELQPGFGGRRSCRRSLRNGHRRRHDQPL